VQLLRRRFLSLAAAATALPSVSRIAWAETYPSKAVRLIVGFPPGGGVDLHARLFGQWLSQRLGQPFIVENRPGAGSNIGTEAVVRAPADGYTLLAAFSTNAINATLYKNLNFNFIRDTAPVASIDRGLLIMLVNPSFAAKTIPELIAFAKANPNKINMASAGIGTPSHVAGELFKQMAGVTMLHVPYRGDAPAIEDLLAGQVQLHIAGAASIAYITAGSLRALAVGNATRSEFLPGVPAVNEYLPGYEASTWFGVVAPKNTAVEIVDILNKQINDGLADAKMKKQLGDLGGTVVAGSPADFGKLIADETAKWAKVIEISGAKPE
jgi:tripartite-type tricarboxylate transporter receptor subunit TctC